MLLQLIRKIKEHKIALSVEDDNLIVMAPKDVVIPDKLIRNLKAHKDDIIRIISSQPHSEIIGEQESIIENAEFETSFRQKFMLDICHEGNSSMYNIVINYRIEGDLVPSVFRQALEKTIERHEILRTIFIKKQEWVQIIGSNLDIDKVFMYSEDAIDAELYYQEELLHIFNFEEFAFKMSLFKTENAGYLLFLNMHHLISDGWSINVFLNDFLIFYRNILLGEPQVVDDLDFQFKEYAINRNKVLYTKKYHEDRAYHLQRFENYIPIVNYPIDALFNPPKTHQFNGRIIEKVYPYSKLEKLRKNKNINQAANFNNYTLLLSILYKTLTKVLDQTDLAIGTPYHARTEKNVENQIGFYIDSLIFRINEDAKVTFDKLLNNVHQQFLNVIENRNYPFQHLTKEVKMPKGKDKFGLYKIRLAIDDFDSMLAIDPLMEDLELGIKSASFKSSRAKLDLYFLFQILKDDKIIMNVEYDKNKFKEGFINTLIETFTYTLDKLTQPSESI